MFTPLLLLLATSATGLHNKIGGGDSTTIDKFPYQLSLEFRYLGHKCGASLIAPNYALTTSKCALLFPTKLLSIRGGSTTHSKGGVVKKITNVCRHLQHNVAVLTLNESFELGSDINTIDLVEENTTFDVGTLANATGWGHVNFFDKPKNLQVVEIALLDFNECAQKTTVSNESICFGNSDMKTGVCLGDTGGPLVIGGKQVAIMSDASYMCSNFYKPRAHINVAHKEIRSFIDKCML